MKFGNFSTDGSLSVHDIERHIWKGTNRLGVKSVRLYFQGGSKAPTSLPEMF